jgi:hypothetical protein
MAGEKEGSQAQENQPITRQVTSAPEPPRTRSGRVMTRAQRREAGLGPLGTTANRNAAQVDIGPGDLLIAPIGTTEPVDVIDTAWPAAWIQIGYTDNGSAFVVDPTIDDVRVAEEVDAVAQTLTSQVSRLEFAMAQISAWHLGVALGGGTVTTGTGIVTFDPPAPGVLKEVMLGWRSAAKDEAWLWRRCVSNGALNLERRTGNNKATIPIQFKVLVPTNAALRPWKAILATAKSGPALTTIYP